jgi:hypothetical protein
VFLHGRIDPGRRLGGRRAAAQPPAAVGDKNAQHSKRFLQGVANNLVSRTPMILNTRAARKAITAAKIGRSTIPGTRLLCRFSHVAGDKSSGTPTRFFQEMASNIKNTNDIKYKSNNTTQCRKQ